MAGIIGKQLKSAGTDEVSIDNPEFAELVKRDRNKAAEQLSIRPDDLSVDDHGRVVVKNATFRARAGEALLGDSILCNTFICS